jgi:hypothetical protein
MNVESAKEKIRGAMETLRQLSCEEPPDNGRTLKELENDKGGNKDSLDSVSHTGQWAYLLLRDALKELEVKQTLDKECVSHHFACDCREAAMKKLIKDLLDDIECVSRTSPFWHKADINYRKRAKELFGELR